jgi:hypothetical protein
MVNGVAPWEKLANGGAPFNSVHRVGWPHWPTGKMVDGGEQLAELYGDPFNLNGVTDSVNSGPVMRQ